jgi:endonuclease III
MRAGVDINAMSIATNNNKTKSAQQKTPRLFQRVAALAAIVGADSDEIDAAILELRKEQRERLVLELAQKRALLMAQRKVSRG